MPKVPISDLVLDMTLHPRSQISDVYVSELTEALRAGTALPPVLVDKESKRVVDGFHRVKAHLRVFGAEGHITVKWKEYADEAELFADAVRLNANHGRRLDRVDLVRCVHIGGRHGIEVEDLAGMMGLRPEKLGELKADRTAFYKGEPFVLRSGMSHLAGKDLTKKQAEATRRSFGNVKFYASRLADLLEADALDLTDENLLEELRRLQTALKSV